MKLPEFTPVPPADPGQKTQKLKWARLAADRLACESVCRFLLAMTRDGTPFVVLHLVPAR